MKKDKKSREKYLRQLKETLGYIKCYNDDNDSQVISFKKEIKKVEKELDKLK